MKRLRRFCLAIPMRPRSLLAILALLALAWVPLVISAMRSWRWFAQEVRDCYSGWAGAVKTAAKALVTGRPQ